MARRVFDDPTSGNRMQFTVTSAALLEIDAVYAPHSPQPPVHYHPFQDEHFEVVEGSLTVLLDGDQRVYHAGEAFDVPARTPHSMWNAGDTPSRTIWQIRPALKTQTFFETSWGLTADGKPPTSNLLQAAVLMRAYHNEFRLVKPPLLVQRILFGLLAPVGRVRGYRARYDVYSG